MDIPSGVNSTFQEMTVALSLSWVSVSMVSSRLPCIYIRYCLLFFLFFVLISFEFSDFYNFAVRPSNVWYR